jgi:hypothetical protein
MATNYVILVTLLLFQSVPRQRIPRQQTPTAVKGESPAAVATFTGKFKAADKKYITVEVEEGQSLRMFITGGTKFVRDGKPAKASDFAIDEAVTVEASRDNLMNLLAVRVENVAEKKPDPPGISPRQED